MVIISCPAALIMIELPAYGHRKQQKMAHILEFLHPYRDPEEAPGSGLLQPCCCHHCLGSEAVDGRALYISPYLAIILLFKEITESEKEKVLLI